MGHGGRRRGQATVEFAFVAPLFLLCFLATVDAALWAVETSAEVSAVQAGARLAAAAGVTPVGSAPPDARSVVAGVAPGLEQALFATTLIAWCDPHATAACATCPSSPAEVEARYGPRVVALCVEDHDPPRCATPPPGVAAPYPQYCMDTPTVTVRLIGNVASLVPPGFSLGSGGEVATDIHATTHTLRFAP